MMISPECFIMKYENKSYRELIKVRDKLIREIRHFEKCGDEISEEIICYPSPETVYRCNLEYLPKLCELISKKYNERYIQNNMD